MTASIITAEERAAQSKYSKWLRGAVQDGLTEEEKVHHRSYWKKLRDKKKSSMTEEEHAAFLAKHREYHRQYRANMSPEQREEYLRKNRERRRKPCSIPENWERHKLLSKLGRLRRADAQKGTSIDDRIRRDEQIRQIKEMLAEQDRRDAIAKYESEKAAFFAKLERGEEVVWTQ